MTSRRPLWVRRVDDERLAVERADEERVDPERDDSDCVREERTFCGGRRREDCAAGREELERDVLRRDCEGPVEP
ncbi:unannotated protein [freshwater metagenome]|uniref:Unannotated protein n=1 Tax=freshwater metagenome TaxID=449393 RepID=A0A6J6DI11_9ZZZZ|nr:hypothetical protein [Actinomycetota bacterium]